MGQPKNCSKPSKVNILTSYLMMSRHYKLLYFLHHLFRLFLNQIQNCITNGTSFVGSHVKNCSLVNTANCRMWLFYKRLQSFGVPVISSCHFIVSVHALLHHRP